jgi:RND family efflux transporter MFP subunit
MLKEDESRLEQAESMSPRKKIVILLGCCLIIGLAYWVSQEIAKSGPKPKKRKAEDMLIRVKATPVKFENHSVELYLNGTVEPSVKLSLKSEISGLIVGMHPKAEIGHEIKKGEVLFELEEIDYRIALASAQASLAKAQMELQVEKGRQALSRQEWELIQLESQASEQQKKLALRKPQLVMAMANEKAARAAVQLALKNLERAKIRAPFDAVIIEKYAEVGSRISPQEQLLMMAKSRPYWIRLTVPQDKLTWLQFLNRDQQGSEARIAQLSSDEFYRGRVLRFLPNLLESTRMAQVLVEVNPHQAKLSPLLLGSYVRVQIQGKELKEVVKVPRQLLKEGHSLQVLNEENRLETRKVTYLSSGRDDLLVQSGLQSEDRLITSQIPAPVEGMKLSVLKE